MGETVHCLVTADRLIICSEYLFRFLFCSAERSIFHLLFTVCEQRNENFPSWDRTISAVQGLRRFLPTCKIFYRLLLDQMQLCLIMCNTKLCRPCVDNVQEGGRSTACRLIIVVLYSLLLKYHISLNSKVISSRASHALGVKWSLTLIAVKHSS